MQLYAQTLERELCPAKITRLLVGQNAATGDLGPAATEAGCTRHPANHLQVSQATRRLLAVGLKRVGRLLKTHVTLPHLGELGSEKSTGIELGKHRFVKLLD